MKSRDRFAASFFKSESGLQDYATRTLRYYEELSAEDPEYDQWKRGAEVVRRWSALISCASVSQVELNELLVRLREESEPGSMWCDLRRRIEDWATALGLECGDSCP
jgi:hypothetical protein